MNLVVSKAASNLKSMLLYNELVNNYLLSPYYESGIILHRMIEGHTSNINLGTCRSCVLPLSFTDPDGVQDHQPWKRAHRGPSPFPSPSPLAPRVVQDTQRWTACSWTCTGLWASKEIQKAEEMQDWNICLLSKHVYTNELNEIHVSPSSSMIPCNVSD